MSFPKVTIMIINYNGLRWLPKCLSSVTRTDYPDYDIYLVDNCSVDGSLDYVRKEFPNVKIINFDTNLGFAEAYNRAIDMVKADYIVLLNNDTEIPDPKWIENLIQETKRDQRVAAVACKMVSMSFPSRLDSVGGMGIPYWRGFVDIGKEEYDTGQYDYENFEPFSFCGGAVLLNRESFIKLGGFDEKFFMYMEDVDLSWRMRLCKYRISFAPEAKVNHYY